MYHQLWLLQQAVQRQHMCVPRGIRAGAGSLGCRLGTSTWVSPLSAAIDAARFSNSSSCSSNNDSSKIICTWRLGSLRLGPQCAGDSSPLSGCGPGKSLGQFCLLYWTPHTNTVWHKHESSWGETLQSCTLKVLHLRLHIAGARSVGRTILLCPIAAADPAGCPQTRRVTGSACMYSFHCCSGNCQLGKCK